MAVMSTERVVVWNHEQADQRRAFATVIAPLVAVLWKRKEDFGAVEARIYMQTLKYVPVPMLVAAVEQSLAVDTWFPEPSKLLAYASDAIVLERRKVQERWLGTDCADCHQSRWVEIAVGGVTRTTRCGCWRRAMHALAEVGEPIARPRLEASNDEP